jgi:hypothetical protein
MIAGVSGYAEIVDSPEGEEVFGASAARIRIHSAGIGSDYEVSCERARRVSAAIGRGAVARGSFAIAFQSLPLLRARAYLARRVCPECWEYVVARSKGARVLARGCRVEKPMRRDSGTLGVMACAVVPGMVAPRGCRLRSGIDCARELATERRADRGYASARICLRGWMEGGSTQDGKRCVWTFAHGSQSRGTLGTESHDRGTWDASLTMQNDSASVFSFIGKEHDCCRKDRFSVGL